MALAIALSLVWGLQRTLSTWSALRWFVAGAMSGLAVQKLRDVESFSTMFLNDDLLARQWVGYAYVYPYAEALAGALMMGAVAPWLSGPIALFIGFVGAASVIKAVYVDRRELKCACVGGHTRTPLGFVSLTESLMIAGMDVWALWRLAA